MRRARSIRIDTDKDRGPADPRSAQTRAPGRVGSTTEKYASDAIQTRCLPQNIRSDPYWTLATISLAQLQSWVVFPLRYPREGHPLEETVSTHPARRYMNGGYDDAALDTLIGSCTAHVDNRDPSWSPDPSTRIRDTSRALPGPIPHPLSLHVAPA